MGPKTGGNKRLSPVLAGSFHQCSSPPIASTLYLIRLDEFRGEGKSTEYRLTKRNKGRESFHYSLFMNFNCWNVNTRQRGGQVLENVAFLVPKCNYFGVFVQIKLLNRGPEPVAACLGMSRAMPIAQAGYRHPTGELI